jgi:tetratricopeptide (TPR) repeat protein
VSRPCISWSLTPGKWLTTNAFLKAIELLQQAARSNHGIYPLDLVIAEVTAKKAASDHAAEAARRAIDLLWQARQDAAAQRFDVAREKLEQAKQLNPANAQVSTRAAGSRGERAGAATGRQRDPSEATGAEEEIIVATLLSTPGESQAPFEQPAAAAEPA